MNNPDTEGKQCAKCGGTGYLDHPVTGPLTKCDKCREPHIHASHGGYCYGECQLRLKSPAEIYAAIKGTAAHPNLADGGELRNSIQEEVKDLAFGALYHGQQCPDYDRDAIRSHYLTDIDAFTDDVLALIAAHDQALKSQLLAAVKTAERMAWSDEDGTHMETKVFETNFTEAINTVYKASS